MEHFQQAIDEEVDEPDNGMQRAQQRTNALVREDLGLPGDGPLIEGLHDLAVGVLAGAKIDKVAGMEARGFILGGAVAHQVSAGFIPIRKKGKLPHKRVSIAYSLEYGLDEMEMHEDAVTRGEKVILVRRETSPEDIHGMHAAEGILTSTSGMTSHAAVVARGMGKPCVAGSGDVRIDASAATLSGAKEPCCRTLPNSPKPRYSATKNAMDPTYTYPRKGSLK